MQAEAVDCVADDKGRLVEAVVKLSHTEMIASAEELLFAAVPDSKGEVADQVFETVFAPGFISVKN